MAITLRFTVEDIADRLLTYDQIKVYRASSLTGSYTSIGTVDLASGTYHYLYSDSAGTLNHWYKYSFFKAPATESALSDPFRVEGVTRLRIRQAALNTYGCGLVFDAAAGGDVDTITTNDFRVKAATQFRANRGKGTWLWVASGTYAESPALIKSSDPTVASFDIEAALGGALAAADDVEWHWLADPYVWNDAINRGLDRYYYVDRVPLPGVAGQYEYDLSSLPWLTDKGQIHDVRYYPDRTSNTDDGVDISWAGAGRWWKPRQDGTTVVLQIYPTIDDTCLLWLECTRPMPHLYTDSAGLPTAANEALCAALAYDEVLAYLSRPHVGTADERKSYAAARKQFAPGLRKLLVDNRPKPRRGPPQLPWVPTAPAHFKAR